MRDETGVQIRLADYRASDYQIDEIALTFQLAPSATRVLAQSQVRRTAAEPCALSLNGERLTLTRIAIDGAPLSKSAYEITDTHLIIKDPPGTFVLDIETVIDPAGNTALEGLYQSNGRYCTQCEAEGFRKITYALDRPDCLARYTVRIEAPKDDCPILLSNGDPVESGDLGDGRHFAVWRDPHPKPAYLFALVAGAFDSLHDAFTTKSGREVALSIHVDHGEKERALYAMDALKRSMKWDEDVFDREYDLSVFNIVAVRDFNFGAMENKGLNIFNAAYVLADQETATDYDFEAIEAVVAHEYFHNWTGNRITLRDWFQLCLKEGLTVYRDQEFSADMRSRPVQRIKNVRALRARQFSEDAGPLAHPVRPQTYAKIDNFYTATVYEKGAEVIRMLRALIGAPAFDRGMQLYFARCDGRAATVEDFIACFAEASGRDLAQFMRWYNQAGTPRLSVETTYDAASGDATLFIAQHTPETPGQRDKQAFPIPLRVGFIAEDGAILAAHLGEDPVAREEHALVLDEPSATYQFKGVARAPIPAVLRGFCAPVIVNDGLNAHARLTQMAHDPDPFTRWEAGQSLMRARILADAQGETTDAPSIEAIAIALSRELANASKDPAFAALALRAPDLTELTQLAPTPDPDALYVARRALRAGLAHAMYAELRALVGAPIKGPFSPGAEQAGERALKSAAMELLAAIDDTDALQRAFEDAATMTERIAALEGLSQGPAAPFDAALAHFHAQWRTSPLVLDKWFAVQASAPREDIAARIEHLATHEDFTLRNPNRARALIATFAMRNMRGFHAKDGSGYQFLAEQARRADALNPALAARLLTAFESWRRFDDARQAKAQAALESLARANGLSANARDVVTRTLG
jgi:aminopeptidase N